MFHYLVHRIQPPIPKLRILEFPEFFKQLRLVLRKNVSILFPGSNHQFQNYEFWNFLILKFPVWFKPLRLVLTKNNRKWTTQTCSDWSKKLIVLIRISSFGIGCWIRWARMIHNLKFIFCHWGNLTKNIGYILISLD